MPVSTLCNGRGNQKNNIRNLIDKLEAEEPISVRKLLLNIYFFDSICS